MATRELEAMLERLGLSRYLEKCKEECIDDACLDHLEPDDVRELGFPIGPRRRFEAALAERRRNRGSAEASPVTPSPARRPEPAAPLAAAPSLPAPPPLRSLTVAASPQHAWARTQRPKGTCRACS